MKRITLAAVSLLLLVLLQGACGVPEEEISNPTDPSPSSDGTVLKSSKSRITTPNASNADMQRLVAGNNDFALALYARLRSENDKSFFFSPMSLSQALSMTYAGALGTTESQMASTLRFTLSQSKLHAAFNALDLALASRGKGARAKDGKAFRLNLSNAIWVQRGYGILTAFLDTLALNYGAGLRLLNFKDYPEPSRKTINEWVSNQTEAKIKELLTPGQILPSTRLVLTNTIYFNAAWAEVFPKELTSTGAFARLDGTTVKLPTMSNVKELPYASGTDYQAVELPYDGKELSMVLIVPKAGQFSKIEATLSAKGIDAIIGTLRPTMLSLTMPKWNQRTRFSGRNQLKALGMLDAFDGSKANFRGINGGIEPLWIDDVVHEAFVDVDEYGTEAAAATAVIMVGGCMPTKMTVDRPFIFLVRDIATRSILFMGRLTNPTP